jgi:hypothetical protein
MRLDMKYLTYSALSKSAALASSRSGLNTASNGAHGYGDTAARTPGSVFHLIQPDCVQGSLLGLHEAEAIKAR